MARRLKKNVKRTLKGVGVTAMALAAIGVTNNMQVFAENQNSVKINKNVIPVYKVKSGAETARTTLLQGIATTEESIDESAVNIDDSYVDISQVDVNNQGLQVVNLKATVATEDSTQDVNQTAVVVVSNNEYPTLKLKTEEITIPNDGAEHYFLPETYISMVHDTATNSLPNLTFEGADTVDTKTDGYYTVKYKATNSLGYSTEKVLTVHVETPQWVIEQRQAEAEQKAYEEEQARIQAEKEAAEQAQKEAEALVQQQEAINSGLQYFGGSNPYSGGWSNCTYGAWQALYNARGISLPNLGNASQWYYNASAAGYSVSGTPTAGGIAVYNGHVAYVDSVSGDMVHIVEGGYSGHYNERWVSAYGTGTKSIIGYINL